MLITLTFDVHIYALLSAIASLLMLIQLSIIAIGLRAYEEPRCASLPTGKRAAIVPVYNEDPNRFREVLMSLKGVFHRVIVVGDGVIEPYSSISKALGAEFYAIPKGGKKRAIEFGVSKLEDEDFVALVDSDTVVPKETAERALAVLNCGYDAVTVRVRVQGYGLLGRLADMYEAYKDVVARGFAGLGKLLVINGQFSVYRAEVLKRIAVNLSGRKVLGRPVIIGDDKELTSRFYELGNVAAYLSSSYVITSSPENVSQFIKQVIRWTRASYLYFIIDLAEGNFSRGVHYFVSGSFSLVLPFLTAVLSFTSVGMPRRLVIHFSVPQIYVLVKAFKWLTSRTIAHFHFFHYHYLVPPMHRFPFFDDKLVHHLTYYVDPILMVSTTLVFLAKTLMTIPGIEIARAVWREAKRDITASIMAVGLYFAQTFISLYAVLTLFDFTKWLTREVRKTSAS